ncbi:hypothetical protein [Orientia tsutsugamushi]|uniref:hypothetical protein n=1 Tax=Orientia tsutsugamushi TaxID=784 RepID=UPI003527367B
MLYIQEEIKNYDIAIKYNPNFDKNYLEKGISLVNLGQYSSAKENFLLAIKYNPNIIAEHETMLKRLTELKNFTGVK